MNFIRSTFSPVAQIFAATAIFALVLSLGYGAVPFVKAAQPGSGAVWTTTGSCGEPQNINHYAVGETVYINGSNFTASTLFPWKIQAAAGGNNGVIIATGNVTTNPDGAFCIQALTLTGAHLGGPYNAVVDGKNDNFSVVQGQAATGNITIVKQVNDASGNDVDFGFTSTVLNHAAFTLQGGDSRPMLSQDAGTYTISETAQPQGWSFSSVSCNSGTWSANGSILSVTIVGGENMICTFVNTKPTVPAPAKLTVTKVVLNNSGTGSKVVTDFPLSVNTTGVISGVQNTFSPGAYVVSETSSAGYSATITGDCDVNGNITLSAGDVKSCTITNDDNSPQAGTIKVWKHVVGFEGTPDYSDFSFTVDGGSPITFPANQDYVLVSNLVVGPHTVLETTATGYTTTYGEVAYEDTSALDSDCADIQVTNGGTAFCRITNTVVPPEIPGCMDSDATNYDEFATVDDGSCTYTLTIEKQFAGDYDVAYSAFSFEVNDDEPVTFDAGDGMNELVLGAGTYTVNETPKANYTPSYNQCAGIVLDGPKTCTITNTYVPEVISGCMDQDANNYNAGANTPAACTYDLTVKKQYAGDYDVAYSAFSFTVDGGTPIVFDSTDGENVVSVSEGTHDVVEVESEGFTPSYTNCTDVSGKTTCTITNTAKVDVCPNLDGYQTEIPAGYRLTGGICIPVYTIDGFKWNDLDNDGAWDTIGEGAEPAIPGWTIHATDGDQTLTTQTDANGYYSFEVEAGNWTVSEAQVSGWTQTAPVQPGTCSANLGQPLIFAFALADDSADSVSDRTTSLECNFGNHQNENNEDPKLACSVSASDTSINEGDDVTIFWDTTLADSVTLNGESVESVDGSQIFENLQSDTTYTLVAFENETEDSIECSVSVNVDQNNGGGGGSSGSKKKRTTTSNDPIGEVLGESTSALPVGAPNTGAGGSSSSPIATIISFFGMLLSLVTFRVAKNG